MPGKEPNEFTTNYINTLRNYVFQAECKVNGNSSYDVPTSNYLSNDDIDAVENLNIFLDNIVGAINAEYTTPEQLKAQSSLQNSYMRLIKTSESHERYSKLLTPKLVDKLKPTKSDTDNLNNLKECLTRAKLKLQGINSFDIPATDYIKDDEWTPLNDLRVYFNDIARALNRTYINPMQQEIQSKIREEYLGFIAVAEKRAPHLAEEYKTILGIKENKSVNANNTTIDNKLI